MQKRYDIRSYKCEGIMGLRLPDDMTLGEARQLLRDNWEKGVDCPCCTRLVKLYHYKINSGQARALITLYKLTNQQKPKDGWIHVPQEFAKLKLDAHGMSYHRTALWGLIEQQPVNDDPNKNSSGYWRITEKGKSFVNGRIKVLQSAYVFEGRVMKTGGNPVDIRDALGKKFSYEELMA